MIGKKFVISGMKIEIMSDQGDKWEARNITTYEVVLIDKSVLERAVRLGLAEEILDKNIN